MVYYTTDFFAELDEANDNAVNGDVVALVNAAHVMPMNNWQLVDYTATPGTLVDLSTWKTAAHETAIENENLRILIPKSYHGMDGAATLYNGSGGVDATKMAAVLSGQTEADWFITVSWDNTIKQWSSELPAQCVDVDMCARTKCPG